tara:strand:+ start:558 stop:749 length:192 start_codon:yes stop_codon:yes gene_type:complete
MSSDKHKQDCQDCQHCVVVEDRNYDYTPFGSCSKGNEVIELDINDFAPKEYCKDFEEGEPTYY